MVPDTQELGATLSHRKAMEDEPGRRSPLFLNSLLQQFILLINYLFWWCKYDGFFLFRILKSIPPKFQLPGAVSSLAPWTDPYLTFLMAAISCCELWSVCAALLRLGELNLPALQSSEISDYYLNISPYLYFTQKCQIQLWMEHPGKGVALCPCVLWALPAEGLGEWYQCQVHPQHLWIPTLYLRVPETPKFYSSKFTTGCKWPSRFLGPNPAFLASPRSLGTKHLTAAGNSSPLSLDMQILLELPQLSKQFY